MSLGTTDETPRPMSRTEEPCVKTHLSPCGGKPFGRPALPLALGSLDFLPCFLVDADDVVVGKDLAIDHGLFGEGLSLLELGSHPGLFFGPLLLSRLFRSEQMLWSTRALQQAHCGSQEEICTSVNCRLVGSDDGGLNNPALWRF